MTRHRPRPAARLVLLRVVVLLGLAWALRRRARPAPATSLPRDRAEHGERAATGHGTDRQHPGLPSRGRIIASATVCGLVVALLGLSVISIADSAENRSAGPIVAASDVDEAATEVTTFDFESLGRSWPAVRAIMDSAVTTARANGFDLQLCLRALDTRAGEAYCAGPEQSRYAASTIKVPLAVAALEKHGSNPDTPITVHASDIRGGSGTIRYDGPGVYTVGELIRRALVVSDNTAAAMLLRDLGSIEAANAPTHRLDPVPDFAVGNFTGAIPGEGADTGSISAGGAARYMVELVRCERDVGCSLTTPRVARDVLDLLRLQEIVTKLGLHLEPGTHATKGGDTETVSHDLAVVDTARGEVVLTAVSTAHGPSYPDWIIADAARDVVAALAATR